MLFRSDLRQRLPATTERLDVELARLDPSSVYLALREADGAQSDLKDREAAPWCFDDRKGCLDKALRLAARVERLAPSSCDGFYFHAETLLAAGDAPGAVKELSEATGKVTDRTYCLERLAEVARLAKADPPLSETLDQISRAGCADFFKGARDPLNRARSEERRVGKECLE